MRDRSETFGEIAAQICAAYGAGLPTMFWAGSCLYHLAPAHSALVWWETAFIVTCVSVSVLTGAAAGVGTYRLVKRIQSR